MHSNKPCPVCGREMLGRNHKRVVSTPSGAIVKFTCQRRDHKRPVRES